VVKPNPSDNREELGWNLQTEAVGLHACGSSLPNISLRIEIDSGAVKYAKNNEKTYIVALVLSLRSVEERQSLFLRLVLSGVRMR
jgi:hypothetical protein